MKRPVVLCIFAHPDDETFGPSGTIHKLTKTHDVYIVCATRGDAGENHSKSDTRTLGEIREEELRKSAAFLGVKKVFMLDYKDGHLSNAIYHTIAADIEKIARKIEATTFITFDITGLSGHIDHIAMALIATYVFEKMKSVKTLKYYCMSETHRKALKKYFIYAPPGRKEHEIDEVINIDDVWDKKMEAIKIHKSQAKDGRRMIKRLSSLPKKEYFRILSQ